MVNNQEIAEKLEQIKSEVTSYIYENMNEDFQGKMNSPEGAEATFTTENGSEVQFTSFQDFIERFVVVETTGKVLDKPFEFNFRSSMMDYGCGTIFSGKYGIAFWNVGNDEMKPTIKPFKKFLGRKSFHFADKAFSEILPLLEEFTRDIKTIQPMEGTKQFLIKQEDVLKKDEVTEISLRKEASQSDVQIHQEQVACIAGTETYTEMVDGVEYEYELCGECGNKMNYCTKEQEHIHNYIGENDNQSYEGINTREGLETIKDTLVYCQMCSSYSDVDLSLNSEEVDTPSSGIKM